MSRRAQSLNHDKYNAKCVCAICTCGVHKCPRNPQNRLRLESETTNQMFYKPHQVQRHGRWKQRPAPIATHYQPDVLQSSYKNTFKGLPLLSQCDKTTGIDGKIVNRKKIPFEGQSAYKSQFLPNEVTVQPRRKVDYCPNSEKFMGQSEYKQNFQRQAQNGTASGTGNFSQNRSSLLDSLPLHKRKRIPFEGQSSYKSQYKQYDVQQPKRSHVKYEPNPAKFQGQSHYKAFYPKYEIAHEAVCPILELPKIPRQPSPGKNHVSYVAEKNVWQ